MEQYILIIVTEFWKALTEMAPYLLFGFFVAGLISLFISTKFVKKQLGHPGILSVVRASLYGVPLPLCSCGVVPVATSIRNSKASKGATVSFLISTPQTGIDSVMVTWGMLGPLFAVFRPLVAFISGVFGGCAVNIFDKDEPETEQVTNEKNNSNQKKIWLFRLFHHGFIILPKDIAKPMLVGLLVAGLISVVVPDDFFSEKLPAGIWAKLIMLMMGIPVYVCSTASVPIAAAMIAKGLDPGAAMVFLMTGPATNAVSFFTVSKIISFKAAIIYLLTVIICALGSGIFLDIVFPGLGGEISEHFHHMQTAAWEHISAVILLLVLFYALIKKA